LGRAILAVLGLVDLGGLLQDLADLDLELSEGAVGPVGGVGGHLGPVQGDHTQADQPGRCAQLQGLDEEPGQGLLVADPEARDRHVVGELVAGQHPEGQILDAAPLELPRGAHPEQGLGVVGGVVVPIGPIATQERTQVELVDHVQDEPGQMVLGSQSRRSGGSRKGWSRSPQRKL
jgi:hypothetical protein